ncbi:MAG: cytochrome c oxidase assembly protein, partial [Acidimicrobiales bacterium]
MVALAVGAVAVGVALAAPLDHRAEGDVAWHMVQHLLLTAVAAPAVALADVPGTLLAALSDVAPRLRRRRRRLIGSTGGRRWRYWAVTSLLAAVATLWFWHLPAPYDAALRNDVVHLAEHATLLTSATVFWWVLVGLRRRRRYGAAVLVAFTFSLSSIALGAWLTFARRPLYASVSATEL